MRFIFVDAENIGLKAVEAITASVSDKVFVFSKNDAVKAFCERNLFLYISSYPTGSNQADFYIIGNLVGMIASLTEQQREASQFILYSQDNSLVTAFEFQCKLRKIKYGIALKPKITVPSQAKVTISSQTKVPAQPKQTAGVTAPDPKKLEQKIYECFKTEQTTESVRKKLKQPKPDFDRALHALIKANKIQRVSKGKKTWGHTKSM